MYNQIILDLHDNLYRGGCDQRVGGHTKGRFGVVASYIPLEVIVSRLCHYQYLFFFVVARTRLERLLTADIGAL